ncbi:VOC family protein [Paraburkholderia flagellata]|uniref:VOC family protein n=1 Tax=Paraburkholderia flagellata TaxID=2883241 RepID=UPI001F4514ED|nr:VOC family protein [Paraburkholderia flagellata]
MVRKTNAEFEIRGVNHVAMVCKDMAKTVEFYRDVLGMPLIKTIDLPSGMGQHFFFDIGNGDSIAFFWFPDAPHAQPGIATPAYLPGYGSIASAHGSMNHIALNVPAEKFDAYVARLHEKGIKLSPVLNHDDSPQQISKSLTNDVFIRSVYFFDPDGICLEFACWTRELDERDVNCEPASSSRN